MIPFVRVPVIRVKCAQEIVKGVDTVLVTPYQWDKIKTAMSNESVYQFSARVVDEQEALVAYVQCVADAKFNTWVVDDSSISELPK